MSSVMGTHGVAQMSRFNTRIHFLPAAANQFAADYSASKAALINLNRSLRSELDKRSVTPP
jgi:NAD(P)-dependent dehydrogenase (short-subunit alcohol dehydrogenase family)